MAASVSGHVAAQPLAEARRASLPAYLKAMLFGSTSIVIGMLWDIAWHRSIGRDTFWSPPHMFLYLGAIVAGIGSAAVIFRHSFGGSAAERRRGVQMWGLHGPLGAFYCSWGAGAMLTSAPFDDWWHNTYGLDTKFLSPPHVLLLLGIGLIQAGTMLTALALQNRHESGSEDDPAVRARPGALRLAYAYAAGVLLITTSILVTAQTSRVLMHSSIFYLVACGVFPVVLVAVAAASKLRWPATTAAALYMGLILINHWIMPLVPAEPKLGPVRQVVTHMAPGAFPLLILAPALAIDWIRRRFSSLAGFRLAVVLGGAFFVALLAAQWPFGSFLMSPLSRNWIFATHELSYFVSPTSYQARHVFYPGDPGPLALVRGLALCLPLAMLSAWLGLAWGAWMRKVQR
jgi:hypothetical protein